MGRVYLSSFIIFLTLGYGVYSIELLANYKYWKSVSDQLTYDYSGNSRHGILSGNYIVTDRGLSSINIYNPSFMNYKSPGLVNYTFSFWIFYTNPGSFWYSLWADSGEVFAIYYDLNTNPFQIRIEIDGMPETTKITEIDISLGWNFHTIVVHADSAIPNRLNIHLYKNLEHLHTNFIDAQLQFTKLNTCHFPNLELPTSLNPILYELWVHTGLSHISELSSLLSIYSCPASPGSLCLPTHPRTMNKLGQLCPDECISNNLSCDTSLNCITKNKSGCLYGLYDLETSECLFYCPNNSCICPEPITYSEIYTEYSCSCNLGYEKISDNPPACMSKHCLSYNKVGYEYICNSTESGYSLDAFGDCCICKSDFTQVSLNPIICVNTSVCINYDISGGDYTCSSCAKGFAIDSEGKCNRCDSNYISVLHNPFTCILEVDNCVSYEKDSEDWNCDECKLGYVKLESESLICKREIDHCIIYDFYSEESKCNLCEIGYAVGPDYECSTCDEGYQYITQDPLVCEREIQHCIKYNSDEDKLKCLECESNYVLLSECVPEMPFCKNYAMIEDQYLCVKCQDGYELGKDRACNLVCDKGYYLNTDYKCMRCSSNCIECRLEDAGIICLKCEYGFELVENICEANKEAEYILEQAVQTTQIVTIASFSVSAVSLDFNSILSLIGTIQIISYIPLYNLNIPSRAKVLLEVISVFKILPNIFEYFIPDEENMQIDRYKRVDVSNELIFINAGKILTMLILIIVAIIILKLFSHLANKLNDISILNNIISKLLMFLEWNFAIGYFIQGTLELTILSLINLYHVSFYSIYSVVGFCISVSILVYYI